MGNKRNEILEALVVKALKSILASDPIFIQSILRYSSDNTFSDPRDIPDLQTVQSLLGDGGITYGQYNEDDLEDNNLDVSSLVEGGNSSFVTRINYDYSGVDESDNPYYPSIEGYFNLFPQEINGKLYIGFAPPTGGSWNITVFATSTDVAPPPPPTDPVITLQPDATATIYEGRIFTQTIAATGASGYQWRKNGVDIPGQNTATLTISNFSASENGSYTCYVYNGGGSVVSDACAAEMFVPIAGQITIINNSGDTVDWEDGQFTSTGIISDGGIKDKNPFQNNQYFGITFKLNKRLTVKRYSNIGALEDTQVYDNTYFPDMQQYISSMNISKGYSAVISII